MDQTGSNPIHGVSPVGDDVLLLVLTVRSRTTACCMPSAGTQSGTCLGFPHDSQDANRDSVHARERVRPPSGVGVPSLPDHLRAQRSHGEDLDGGDTVK